MSFLNDNSPKYRQLIDQVRDQIARGELKHGDRLPSLKEMGRSSVSRPTVEKAYAVLEREGLIERQHGAGVFVRSIGIQATQRIIGLSGIGFKFGTYSPYWAEIMGGANEAAARRGFQLLLLDPASNQGWEKADGVIICDWDDRNVPRKQPPTLPMVSILTTLDTMASVSTDEAQAVELAISHLRELGHSRIGYLHGYERNQVIGHRVRAYREIMAAAKIEVGPNWTHCLMGDYVAGSLFTSVAFKNMQHWLTHGWSESGCTALLCHNDEAALGVMQALTEAGIRVPEDVSVIGFDGTQFCDVVSPRLTSIAFPLREIGAHAVELIFKQIEAGKILLDHRKLPVALRAGGSTAAVTGVA